MTLASNSSSESMVVVDVVDESMMRIGRCCFVLYVYFFIFFIFFYLVSTRSAGGCTKSGGLGEANEWKSRILLPMYTHTHGCCLVFLSFRRHAKRQMVKRSGQTGGQGLVWVHVYSGRSPPKWRF